MTNVGSPENFIDTQGVTLENQTDSLVYDQVLSMTPVNISPRGKQIKSSVVRVPSGNQNPLIT